MNKPIIKLRDCNLLSIDYSSDNTQGCPTCGYGSKHCYDITFEFDTKPKICIGSDEDDNHRQYVDESEFMTLLLRNITDIFGMTYNDFCTFLSRHLHVC